jgi:FkbM family methyltransferase
MFKKAKTFISVMPLLVTKDNIPISLISYVNFFLNTSNPERIPERAQFCYKGRTFFARPKDWPAIKSVLLEREYVFMNNMFKKDMQVSIIDIGANIGTFSLYMLSLYPRATIYSFEPSGETFCQLRTNMLLNSNSDWHVFQYALWKEAGYVGFENRAYSTSSAIETGKSANETIPAMNLEGIFSVCKRASVDLMKMDIEGAEEAVICGSRECLKKVKNLIVELHTDKCGRGAAFGVLKDVYKYVDIIPNPAKKKPLIFASNEKLN